MYRDDLAAAHARIAELERQLEEARNEIAVLEEWRDQRRSRWEVRRERRFLDDRLRAVFKITAG